MIERHREGGAIFDSHGGTLRHVWQHGVGGIAHDYQFVGWCGPGSELLTNFQGPLQAVIDERDDFGQSGNLLVEYVLVNRDTTYPESHPRNSCCISSLVNLPVHVAGSDRSIWDSTMLNASPAAIVYVMTCLFSPILRK
jgi:hypothetical protein